METLPGKFKSGIQIGSKRYTKFAMREATLADMASAELEAAQRGGGVHTPIIFNTEMMLLQIVQLSNDEGDVFDGVLTYNMISGIKPTDYRAMREVQARLDELGEAE